MRKFSRLSPFSCLPAGIAMAVAASVAQAAPIAPGQCGAHSAMVAEITAKYHEDVRAVALDNDGALMQILVSPHGETWTVLFVGPDGKACVGATGTDWQDRRAPVYHPEQDS